MITQDQIDRYEFQKTEKGKEILQMVEFMKNDYCRKLQIPPSQIKTGRLKPLVNGNTNLIDKFIEE